MLQKYKTKSQTKAITHTCASSILLQMNCRIGITSLKHDTPEPPSQLAPVRFKFLSSSWDSSSAQTQEQIIYKDWCLMGCEATESIPCLHPSEYKVSHRRFMTVRHSNLNYFCCQPTQTHDDTHQENCRMSAMSDWWLPGQLYEQPDCHSHAPHYTKSVSGL